MVAVRKARKQSRRRSAPAADMGPEEFQERHSPTVPVTVRMQVYDPASGRIVRQEVQQTRRRKSDARIWEQMSGEQEVAAFMIFAAFMVMAGEVGVKVAAFLRERGAPCDDDTILMLRRHYVKWSRDCAAHRLNVSACMDFLAHGESMGDIERKHRKRHGWALRNLLDCLDVYCKLRGWKRRD